MSNTHVPDVRTARALARPTPIRETKYLLSMHAVVEDLSNCLAARRNAVLASSAVPLAFDSARARQASNAA